jgi:hypothetical protein
MKHTLRRNTRAKDFNSVSIREAISDFPGLCGTVGETKFQDGPAMEVFQMDNVIRCVCLGMNEEAYFLAPWAFLEMAICGDGISKETREHLLILSFTILYGETLSAEAGLGRDSERGSGSRFLRFWTSDQIYRGCNLCLALFIALRYIRFEQLALGRVGSHSLECHFGMVRRILTGDDRWSRWLSAEAYAVLMEAFAVELGATIPKRRGRVPISGVIVSPEDEHPDLRPGAVPMLWPGPLLWRDELLAGGIGALLLLRFLGSVENVRLPQASLESGSAIGGRIIRRSRAEGSGSE